jgi:hypothetical protein
MTTTTYIAQSYSTGKWLTVCRFRGLRKARTWATKKHPDTRFRFIRATFETVKPHEVR